MTAHEIKEEVRAEIKELRRIAGLIADGISPRYPDELTVIAFALHERKQRLKKLLDD